MKPIRYLALGDSYTIGEGVDDGKPVSSTTSQAPKR